MKSPVFLLFAGTAVAILWLTGCVHTPPGTSVKVAMAKRAELVRLPQPVVAETSPRPAAHATYEADKTELVADAYSRGEFCMKAGKDEEAIDALREVVKLDPKFTDAWTLLAALYEKSGDEKQAMDAFRKSKVAIR